MGIERGHAASHQAAAAGQRPAAAGKATAQAAASGDFLALMAALEDGAGVLDGEALAALPGEALVLGKSGKCAKGGKGVTTEADASLPDAAAAAAAAVAQASAQAASTASRAPVDGALAAALPGAGVASAAVGVAGAAAEAAALRQAAGLAATGGAPAEASSTGAAPTATAPAAPAAATTPPTGAAPADPRLAPQYASVFEQLRQHLAAREAAGPESALRPVGAASTPAAAATSAATAASARELPRSDRGVAIAASPLARTETVSIQELASAAADTGARAGGQDTPGGGTGQHTAQHSGAAGWTAPDFTPTVQYDAALGGLDASIQTDGVLERQLADQLRHWASQGVRSAELTVGTTEPVQVRIALDGNEAQVQFRAEHAATRDMLSGSVEQLRELLGAQGLVLSGVSVGAHDTGGGRGQPGEGAASRAAPQRQAAAAPAEAVAEAAPRRSAGALDLYV